MSAASRSGPRSRRNRLRAMATGPARMPGKFVEPAAPGNRQNTVAARQFVTLQGNADGGRLGSSHVSCQHIGVFDGHGRSLGGKGRHGVRRIADCNNACRIDPGGGGGNGVDRPDRPGAGLAQTQKRVVGACESVGQRFHIGFFRPCAVPVGPMGKRREID
jgi:hypothetical protein